jgi:hypothetical protein
MKALLFSIALALLKINSAACQEQLFTLEGTINIDTGYIKLRMVGDSSFYPRSVRHLISPIKNGKFIFESKIPHPIAYHLESTSGYSSDVIVIEPGKQWVRCNVDSSRFMPEIENIVMKEYVRYRGNNDRNKYGYTIDAIVKHSQYRF